MNQQLDKVILLLVSGLSVADIERACTQQLGMSLPEAKETIVSAQDRIVLAAKYDRQKEIGTALTRCNDLYARALKGKDFKTSLACQKEINKLLRLNETAAPAPADAEANAASPLADELAEIRRHLLPLKLAGDAYPLAEHARVAAEVVRRARAKGVL